MNNISSYVGIFSPLGEPILPHLLCCGSFAVDDHSFMARRLASAATSTCHGNGDAYSAQLRIYREKSFNV
jgi:hypothetical protein